MSAESILKIAERFKAKAAAAPESEHGNLLIDYLTELGADIAGTVVLAASAEAARTPIEEHPALSRRLEVYGALVGCDFATQTRRSVYPDLSPDAPMTEIELFAARTYWRELARLVRGASATEGSA